MAPTPSSLFLSAVAFLLVHELDAVRRREWKFFFAPVAVGEETAYRAFAALHVPLFVLVLWYLRSPSFQVAFGAFAVAHAGLHLALRNRPELSFDSWFSWVWILGAAVLGALHLVAVAL
jgi:hypothetical protein